MGGGGSRTLVSDGSAIVIGGSVLSKTHSALRNPDLDNPNICSREATLASSPEMRENGIRAIFILGKY